jgi:hypothetical protein
MGWAMVKLARAAGRIREKKRMVIIVLLEKSGQDQMILVCLTSDRTRERQRMLERYRYVNHSARGEAKVYLFTGTLSPLYRSGSYAICLLAVNEFQPGQLI